MKLINGRTPEQWAAYDRGKLIGSAVLALLLLALWLVGRGPGRAGACCTAPPEAAANVPPAAPVSPATPAATPDPCAGALDRKVLFATNSAELTAESRALLGRLAPCLRQGRFEVVGHADASGTDAINQPLAERRARAVKNALVGLGIDAAALTARGYGSSRPVASNASLEDRAKNRRVEFLRR